MATGMRPPEQLDQVEWASLSHAGGLAGDIPYLIRALAEPDSVDPAAAAAQRTQRDVAESELWSAVLRHGDLYEATSQVLPFVLWLLVNRPALRPMLVEWLTDVSWVIDAAATEGAVTDCRDVLLAAVPDLLPVLDDPTPFVRATVAGFLGSCPLTASLSWPAIASRWASDPDAGVQADELISLGALAGPADRVGQTQALIDSWWQSANGLQRLAAAHARLMVDPDHQASREELVAALDDSKRLGYWWGSGGIGAIVETLACGHEGLTDPDVLPAVFAAIPRAGHLGTAFVAARALECLLIEVFGEPAGGLPAKSSHLTQPQRKVLEYLASGSLSFHRAGQPLETAAVMSAFQLPTEPAVLRQWLAGVDLREAVHAGA